MKRENAWAITGRYGLYYSLSHTRRDAIADHTQALGRTWAYCRRKGDRAVKVVVSYPTPKGGARDG